MRYKWLFFLMIFPFFLFGQEKSYLHLQTKQIRIDKPVIQIDTFSIQPFYFEIYNIDNQPIDKNAYQVDFVSAKLYWLDYSTYRHQIVRLKYLTYPAVFRKKYQKFKPEIYQNDTLQDLGFDAPPSYRPKPFEGLKTQGSITRGVQAGNNQSLVMQSGLDLKIKGNLSKKIQVTAVLSDDNMPQAYAGISQSYKEFDRIYMQIAAPEWQVTGGDLIMQNQDRHFVRFLRKTQGIDLQIGKDSSRLQIGGGYVEGQFAINRIQGREGNQGPYVLQGSKGESYIFVIPQSEKIYVNGKLLQRGEQKDYTLNYETAELVFNPGFPVTQNMRIVAEFNYANQHYGRYLNHNTYRHKGKDLDYQVFTYYETDAKTQNLLFEPDAQQINILKNAGDRLQDLWVTSAKETSYNPQKILYKKITATPTDYFEYTTTDSPPLYEVKFSFVGKNKGSYRIQKVIANGTIYEYAGLYNGDYEPVTKLTAPQNKIYSGVNLHYHPNMKTDLKIGSVLNYNDKNLFSSRDDKDNLGNAFYLQATQQLWQKKQSLLKAVVSYDFTHRQFEAIDPYRSPEFLRQWQIDSLYGKQHLLDLGVDFSHQNNAINSGFRLLQLRDSISARQAYWQANGKLKNWQYNSDWHYTTQKNKYDLQALYIHQDISLNRPKMLYSVSGHLENRIKKEGQKQDSLNYKYQFIDFRIANKDSSRIGYSIFYKHEQNDSIYHNNFNRFNIVNSMGLSLKKQGKLHRITLFAQLRLLENRLREKNQKNLNLKLTWEQALPNRFITGQIRLESYNANTLKSEIVFVETPPGQGIYIWNDYNQNGIKEINEFEVAVYSDQANYIRVILPSKNYIATINNVYAAQLIINPGVWKKKSFFKKLYGILQYNTRHQTIKKNDFPLVWQPDDALQQNSLWQQDWFINRSKKKYHLHFTYRYLEQKQLLLVGKQAHYLEQYVLQNKHSFSPGFVWEQKLAREWNTNTSEDYGQKNFKIYSRKLKEQLNFLQGNRQKISVFYHVKLKENTNNTEKLLMQKLGASYFIKNKKDNIFNLDLQYINNRLQGDSHSPVAYQMLEALQPGNNLVFTALWRQKLNSYLVLNLNYNFRLSENNPAVHTGGVQLKMIF